MRVLTLIFGDKMKLTKRELDSGLKWASYNGHIGVVKTLLENGADVHANNNYALKWASRNGHVEVVKTLLENGANVRANNNYALRWASENGHVEVVNLLKQYGERL